MTRYDTWLLWPSRAEDILDGVLAILRRQPDMKLVRFQRIEVPDLPAFMAKVYALDAVPLEHLREKLAYLTRQPGPAVMYAGVVRNTDPQVERVNLGSAYEHDQCKTVCAFKAAVRTAYNPHGTEEHVIHASDTPCQAEALAAICGLLPMSAYDAQPCAAFLGLPYHLEPFTDYRLTCFRPSEVRLVRKNAGEVWPIPLEESPHYQFVHGDRTVYEAYWRKYRGRELTEDHSPGAFAELLARPELAGDGPCVVRDGRILDGTHRLAMNFRRAVVEVLA